MTKNEMVEMLKRSVCEANLRDTDLTGANLSEANLREANLREANLRDTDLTGADLRDTDLTGANLREANLRWADLTGADLREANIINMRLDQWSVYIQPETIRIGCEYHTVDEWKAFSEDQISAMDSAALEFWKKYKALIFVEHETLGRKDLNNGH